MARFACRATLWKKSTTLRRNAQRPCRHSSDSCPTPSLPPLPFLPQRRHLRPPTPPASPTRVALRRLRPWRRRSFCWTVCPLGRGTGPGALSAAADTPPLRARPLASPSHQSPCALWLSLLRHTRSAAELTPALARRRPGPSPPRDPSPPVCSVCEALIDCYNRAGRPELARFVGARPQK